MLKVKIYQLTQDFNFPLLHPEGGSEKVNSGEFIVTIDNSVYIQNTKDCLIYSTVSPDFIELNDKIFSDIT